MAETENISKMAEILAKSIFSELKWKQVGPLNSNFKCEIEDHSKKSHPSDIVYWYKDPYTGSKVHVLCDLKSYARNSISADAVRGATSNLALAVDCAKVSGEWRGRYVVGSDNTDLVGMLFIFNHDGGWDASFSSFLGELYEEYPRIPSGVRLHILGPQDIWYLNDIVHDIKVLRGEGSLPAVEHCSFYYPDLSRAKVALEEWSCAATLESLKAPWQIIKFRDEDESLHLLVYYRGTGDTVQEFVYLIDKLVHFQLVAMCKTISLRAPNASQNAAATFDLAINEYLAPSGQTNPHKKKLEKLQLNSISRVTPNFSEIEIGMDAR